MSSSWPVVFLLLVICAAAYAYDARNGEGASRALGSPSAQIVVSK